MIEQEQPGAGQQPPEQEVVTQNQPTEAAPTEATTTETGPLTETEELAATMGWTPPDKWRGPPESHRSAKEFIAKTIEVNKNLRDKVERNEHDFADRIDRSERMYVAALQRQRQTLWQQWEAAKENAAAVGDVEQYRQYNDGQARALNDFDQHVHTAVAPQREQNQSQQIPKEVTQFVRRNADWYKKDEILTGAAITVLDGLDRDFPNMDLEDKLLMVEDRIKKEFPHKFNGQSSSNSLSAPHVEGGLRQIRTSTGKGFNHLPPEAKQQAAKEVKAGLFKDVNEFAAEYWKD